ncbi:hypothetical protein CH75_09535 [Dyella jiangningensis]|nr:hypothetical protein CH75_08995 [Dyella jiangningensis]AHX13425.1 hypothetical protein CH75_09535 [Dyella jiangningensis]
MQLTDREHHLLVAVFDATTGERIEQAEVAVDSTIGGRAVHRSLVPMRINGTTSFGGMFTLEPDQTYRFKTTVRHPGHADPVVATYVYTTAHPMHQ